MNPIEQRLQQELIKIKENHLFRTLNKSVVPTLINCAGNSYLNLHNDTSLNTKARALCETASGNGASRLVQEVSPLFNQLEKTLKHWHSTEKALLFNSGYVANLSIIQALASKKTAIFCDRLNHASIIDGVRLSGAKLIRYNHCDTQHLASLLNESTAEEKCVITDTVFSMDGTIAPLEEIAALCEKHNALLMVDEAHATGVFGKTGAGLVEALGLEDNVALQMGTLSKAICGVGGFVACSQLYYDFFVNRCRGLIYSTALPPSALAWNIVAIETIQANASRGKELLQKAQALRTKLKDAGIPTGETQSQIVPVITHTEESALALSQHLNTLGYTAPAIRPPTVPSGSSRVRLSLHVGISDKQLTTLADSIIAWNRD